MKFAIRRRGHSHLSNARDSNREPIGNIRSPLSGSQRTRSRCRCRCRSEAVTCLDRKHQETIIVSKCFFIEMEEACLVANAIIRAKRDEFCIMTSKEEEMKEETSAQGPIWRALLRISTPTLSSSYQTASTTTRSSRRIA